MYSCPFVVVVCCCFQAALKKLKAEAAEESSSNNLLSSLVKCEVGTCQNVPAFDKHMSYVHAMAGQTHSQEAGRSLHSTSTCGKYAVIVHFRLGTHWAPLSFPPPSPPFLTANIPGCWSKFFRSHYGGGTVQTPGGTISIIINSSSTFKHHYCTSKEDPSSLQGQFSFFLGLLSSSLSPSLHFPLLTFSSIPPPPLSLSLTS